MILAIFVIPVLAVIFWKRKLYRFMECNIVLALFCTAVLLNSVNIVMSYSPYILLMIIGILVYIVGDWLASEKSRNILLVYIAFLTVAMIEYPSKLLIPLNVDDLVQFGILILSLLFFNYFKENIYQGFIVTAIMGAWLVHSLLPDEIHLTFTLIEYSILLSIVFVYFPIPKMLYHSEFDLILLKYGEEIYFYNSEYLSMEQRYLIERSDSILKFLEESMYSGEARNVLITDHRIGVTINSLEKNCFLVLFSRNPRAKFTKAQNRLQQVLSERKPVTRKEFLCIIHEKVGLIDEKAFLKSLKDENLITSSV